MVLCSSDHAAGGSSCSTAHSPLTRCSGETARCPRNVASWSVARTEMQKRMAGTVCTAHVRGQDRARSVRDRRRCRRRRDRSARATLRFECRRFSARPGTGATRYRSSISVRSGKNGVHLPSASRCAAIPAPSMCVMHKKRHRFTRKSRFRECSSNCGLMVFFRFAVCPQHTIGRLKRVECDALPAHVCKPHRGADAHSLAVRPQRRAPRRAGKIVRAKPDELSGNHDVGVADTRQRCSVERQRLYVHANGFLLMRWRRGDEQR